MIEIPNLNLDNNLTLRVILVVHFVFVSLALTSPWIPSSYLFYNGFLIVGLIWTINRPCEGFPLVKSLFVNAFAVLMDVVVLSANYTPVIGTNLNRFGAAMMILNLLLRPVSCFLMARIYNEKRVMGQYEDWSGNTTDAHHAGPAGHNAYENFPAANDHVATGGSDEFGSNYSLDTKPLAP